MEERENSWDWAVRLLKRDGYLCNPVYVEESGLVECEVSDLNENIVCYFETSEEHIVQFILSAIREAMDEVNQ